MGNYTAGPWIVARKEVLWHDDCDGIVVESPNEHDIRPAGGQKLGDELADLTLISAAPELLNALVDFVDLYNTDEGCKSLPQYLAAVAAIKKAKTVNVLE